MARRYIFRPTAEGMECPYFIGVTTQPIWFGKFCSILMEWTVCLDVFLHNLRLSLDRYRTLADRLLHMRLVPSRGQVKRDVSYEFMNRQMVWHAFTVSGG